MAKVQAQSPYIPLPLGTHSIRLLQLLPAAKVRDPVRCTLQVASLLDNNADNDDAPCPEYTALSYAWQDDPDEGQPAGKPKAPIFCNGYIIFIPTNLVYLLIRLRASERRHGGNQQSPQWLWADSICINQDDLDERSEQVSLMKDIFRRSREVIIWLGETGHDIGPQWNWTGDGRDQPLIDVYQGSFERKEPLLFGGHGGGEGQRGGSREDYVGAFCLLSRLCQVDSALDIGFYGGQHGSNAEFTWGQRVKRALWWIVDRAWWNRTWVVQECILAQSATVMCANMTAPWAMLAGAAKVHMHNRAWIDTSETVVDPLDTLSRLIIQIESPRAVLATGKFLEPLQALQQFHVRRATDPRDKVFGILSLLNDTLIEPDYHMTKLDVFFNTTVNILSKTGRLDILNGIHSSETPGLPTWCTDWGVGQDQSEWQRIKSINLHKASAGVLGPICLHQAPERQILEVMGIIVDRVAADPNDFIRAPDDLAGKGRWQATAAQWASTLGTSRASTDEFWMALCGGLLYADGGKEAHEGGFRRATPGEQRHYRSWIADDTAKMHRKSRMRWDRLEAYGEFSKVRNEFFFAMQIATARRRMFVTKGRSIGVGPSWVGHGDLVVVLAGSSVPLLLRQSVKSYSCNGDGTAIQQLFQPESQGNSEGTTPKCREEHVCYEIVGDAYVSGLMDGEAFASAGAEMTRLHLI